MIGPAEYGVVPKSLPAKTVPTGTAEPVATAGGSKASRAIMVQSPSSNTKPVFVGGAGVTTTTGIEIQPKGDITLELSDAASLYCISADAAQTLRILVL